MCVLIFLSVEIRVLSLVCEWWNGGCKWCIVICFFEGFVYVVVGFLEVKDELYCI